MFRSRTLIREVTNKRSVFMRIYILMAALIVVLTVFTMFWINMVAQRNNRRLIAEGNLSRLQTMNTAAEQLLLSGSHTMSQMMWSKDFLDFMISGGKADESRDYRIIRMLTSGVKGSNNVLRRILFGSETSGKLYQSDANGYLDPAITETYQMAKVCVEGGQSVCLGTENNITTYLVCTGRRVLMIGYLQLAGTNLGMIIGEFDQNQLEAVVAGSSQDEEIPGVYIFDKNGLPVLGQVLDYAEAEGSLAETAGYIRADAPIGQNWKIPDHGWYYLQSETLGWQYLMPIDMSGTGASLRDITYVGIPQLLFMLLVILTVVFYMVKALYEPIDELVKMVVPTTRAEGGEAAAYRNPEAKVQALYGAYSQAQLKQKELQSTLDLVALDVLEVLIRKLLNGRSLTRSRMEEILEGIGNPLDVDGRYVICTCMIEEPGNRIVSEREQNMYVVSLQNSIQEMQGTNHTQYMIRVEHNTLVILMGFEASVSAVAIKRVCLDQIQQLKKKTGPLPYRLWAEYGRICGSLMDIHESYLESLEKIHYQRYSEDSNQEEIGRESAEPMDVAAADGGVTEEVPAGSTRVNRGYIRDRAREMVDAALNGERDLAMAVQHRLLDEIEAEAGDMVYRKEQYKSFLDELMEKVIAYPLSAEEQKTLTGPNLADVRIAAAGEEELNSFMEERGMLICDLLGIYGRKNQYKYVQQAKDYIEVHYADSDLSLNDVAESIGISGSYLSELFAEVNGSRFSGYLAEYRVGKARQLLQATTLTIRDIGFQCGFNSVQNFIRVFKKISGYTPGQYRDLQKQTENR